MLEKNVVYEAVITDYTAEGQGIAHIEGITVFIPNAIAGERVLVRIEIPPSGEPSMPGGEAVRRLRLLAHGL